MSKVFFDHLIVLEEVEGHINKATETSEEKEELWRIVDEIIHHRVLGCIFDHLPHEHHDEFLNKIHERPHDEENISYLNEKIESDVKELIRKEISKLEADILREIGGS